MFVNKCFTYVVCLYVKKYLIRRKKSAKNDEFFYRRLFLLTNILSNIFFTNELVFSNFFLLLVYLFDFKFEQIKYLIRRKKSAKNDEFFYRRLFLLTNILSDIFFTHELVFSNFFLLLVYLFDFKFD